MSKLDEFYQTTIQGVHWFLVDELKWVYGSDFGYIGQANDLPRTIAINAWVRPGKFNRLTGKTVDLSMAAGLSRDAVIRIGRGHKGSVILEVPKPANAGVTYNLTTEALPQKRGMKIYIGRDQEFRPASIDLSSAQANHLIIAGSSGGGKTNNGSLIMRHIAMFNEPEEAKLLVFDCEKKGYKWQPFYNLPHLMHPHIHDYDEARLALAWVLDEIERRKIERRNRPHLFLLVDEWQDMVEKGEDFVQAMAKIGRMGREYNVRYGLIAQNPTLAKMGDPDVVRNANFRLVALVDSTTAAQVATGQDGSFAHKLTGAGDDLLVAPGAGMRRIAVPELKRPDFERLPRAEVVHPLNLDQYRGLPEALSHDDNQYRPQGGVLPAPGGILAADSTDLVWLGGPKSDPLTIEQLMYALASGRGVQHLAEKYGVGAAASGKAAKLRTFAQAGRAALLDLGYTVVPADREGVPLA